MHAMLAAAGLPPFGGFVSEWLLLQSFLFTPGLPNSFLNMLIPIVAAVIALVGALAGYVMRRKSAIPSGLASSISP